MIAPAQEQLEQDLARGLPGRYQDQLPTAAAALDRCESEPVRRLWAILRRHGRALPQERYLAGEAERRLWDYAPSRAASQGATGGN